jgi:prefoldin subunit 5
MVTSVTVNATSTNILENSKLFPGVNMQFLGAIYGEAKKDVTFPDIEGVEPVFTAEQGDLLYNKERGAGKVYFTLNPSNIDASKANNLTLSLTDSKNGTSLITLGKAKASDKYLAWGTRADGDVTLWEADATANPEKLGQIAPAELINLKQVAEHVKDMVKAAKSVDKSASSVKNATKDILKETSALIADLAQTKLPALPALALKAQWNDVVGTRSVISDYSIAATSFKPVDFYWGQGIVPENASISLEKIDKIALDIVNKIKAQEPDMTKYIINKVEKITINNGTAHAKLKVTIEGKTGTAEGDVVVPLSNIQGDFDKVVEDLNASLDMLNGAISDIQNILNKVNNAGVNALTLEKKVTNYLESYINRIISSISANGLYKLLEPMVLVENENGGVNRLVSGVTLKAGKVTLLPTTVTNELLAPAFKKYIAVNGEGGKVLTNGDDNFKKYEITLVQGKNVITYAALDFYGNQVVKTFTVTAE